MKYFVRRPADSKMLGPYSLAEIQQQLKTGDLELDYEAHSSDGQSYGALKRSTTWVPLSAVSSLESTSDAQPVASAQFVASESKQIEKSKVGLVLSVFAWIELIASPIASLIVGSAQSGYAGWVVFFSGFVSGLFLLGFARIIEHLFESAQSLHRIEKAIAKIAEDRDAA